MPGKVENPLNEKLNASRVSAIAAKEAFQRKYASDRADRAIGIGLNSMRNNWAVKVYAETRSASNGLPTEFNGYEVDVVVTGKAKAR
ncbi:MAG: hypothetical protein ACLPN5_19810 [Roseiarcus sp.]